MKRINTLSDLMWTKKQKRSNKMNKEIINNIHPYLALSPAYCFLVSNLETNKNQNLLNELS